jgi:hypothetical protein
VLYGMNCRTTKNWIDPIFVCHAVQHLSNMSECVNTPLKATAICIYWRHSISTLITPLAQAMPHLQVPSLCSFVQS